MLAKQRAADVREFQKKYLPRPEATKPRVYVPSRAERRLLRAQAIKYRIIACLKAGLPLPEMVDGTKIIGHR